MPHHTRPDMLWCVSSSTSRSCSTSKGRNSVRETLSNVFIGSLQLWNDTGQHWQLTFSLEKLRVCVSNLPVQIQTFSEHFQARMSIIPPWLHFTFSPNNWIGLPIIIKGNSEQWRFFLRNIFPARKCQCFKMQTVHRDPSICAKKNKVENLKPRKVGLSAEKQP